MNSVKGFVEVSTNCKDSSAEEVIQMSVYLLSDERLLVPIQQINQCFCIKAYRY